MKKRQDKKYWSGWVTKKSNALDLVAGSDHATEPLSCVIAGIML